MQASQQVYWKNILFQVTHFDEERLYKHFHSSPTKNDFELPVEDSQRPEPAPGMATGLERLNAAF